jgi:glycosyltransferase involved in cell wall biosynthesis
MFESITVAGYLLLTALALVLLVQLYYHFGILGKFAFYKPQPSYKRDQEPVSIIIAARNEYDNLQKYLPLILNQDYPEFEVVVVNHCSWDMSQQLLEEMQLQYKHLKVSQLIEQEKYPTGKKFALTIGIKAAKYDQLLFTDADCEPASNQWLRLMESRFMNNTEIVLGFSPYHKKRGLLNLFDRFETFMTAVFYFAFALAGNAFMGVGRNMAYRKNVFFRHKGFASHQHIMSGDDDLFVNEAATPYNVAIECDSDSFVYTDAKETYEKWSRQKTRHMTTGKLYKTKHQVALGVYYGSLFLFYGVLIATLIVQLVTWPFVLGMYLVRLITQVIVYYKSAVKLKSTSLIWYLPLLDLLYVWYLIVFGIKGLFTKNAKVW